MAGPSRPVGKAGHLIGANVMAKAKRPERLKGNQKLLMAAEFLQIMNMPFGVKGAEYRVLNTLLYYERLLGEPTLPDREGQ